VLAGARYSEAPVVVDGRVITSRGAGTAMDFALALVERLVDRETAQRLRAQMVVPSR
jgi:transcriptional regulator GlxA family with amidase domain